MKPLTPVSAVSARFYWVSADTGEPVLMDRLGKWEYDLGLGLVPRLGVSADFVAENAETPAEHRGLARIFKMAIKRASTPCIRKRIQLVWWVGQLRTTLGLDMMQTSNQNTHLASAL